MKRYPQDKRMSAKSFNRRADKTSRINLMSPRRGGIRL